ncbi:hypothetical protein BDY19DRAFT_1072510 [Irpex rosettiformis]|uniref:Uncharacterized protein n=1 Tax=Irpex rosettiformis TaxID=378272 RepID=A0ACB8U1C8_9APHY|nr:hypothetical protein BDY19DRAFT_1072510 [Irpex rosettiformis]
MSSDYENSDNEYFEDDDEIMDEDDGSASDMEVDGFDNGYKTIGNKRLKSYEVDYEPLSQKQIEDTMKNEIDYISGLCGVDADVASLLLRYFDWNREKLVDKYMDNADGVKTNAGVSPPEKPEPSTASSSQIESHTGPRRSTRRANSSEAQKQSKTKAIIERISPPVEEPYMCPICCDYNPTDTRSLACEHKFCSSCWSEYIKNKVRNEAEQWITCMAEDCNIAAPNQFVQDVLAEDPAVWNRFKELLVRHYVASNKNLKYCPYPSCTYTVSCPSASSKSSLTTIVPIVTCGASPTHKFCFGCNIDDDHRPVVCAAAKLWLQKCQDDSETANWIKTNTKECSKCQSTIEKNGGCNHMTCKKCKYEFCWVCMGPWSEHGTAWYSCNRYDEKASIEARDAQSRSRASLERYLHYYNRWANHEQSAKLSVELYAKTEKKMEEMQMTSVLTWIEVQFMKKALDEVSKCRMTLKWTYAMAYYLESGNEKELFEDNQRDLERAVEELSELIESPLDTDTITDLRQKVTDKTVYVQKRNEIVLEDTAQGFQDGRWKWNCSVDGFD